jgi:hypothetical protein
MATDLQRSGGFASKASAYPSGLVTHEPMRLQSDYESMLSIEQADTDYISVPRNTCRDFLSSCFPRCVASSRSALIAICAVGILSACSSTVSPASSQSSSSPQVPSEFGSPNTTNGVGVTSPQSIDQSQLLQAQANQAKKVEIIFSARVKKILPDDTKGLPHQRLILAVENGSTVLLAHDIKYAPKVPVQVGDMLVVKGEYIWNRKGGVVHWTHHSDSPRHEGGYIEFGGQKYE